jgi:hypothetical protein
VFAAVAGAAETPKDFAYGARIELEGRGALYRLALTQDVYRGIADPGLADLRVFNGAGEEVPHALYPRRPAPATVAVAAPLKVFRIPAAAASGPSASATALHIQTDAQGAVVRVDLGRGNVQTALVPSAPAAYLLDASALREPIHALEVEVQAPNDYSGKARVEASDDLVTWREIAADAPILGLTHADERLERRRIDFAARKSKYYRLSWAGMPAEAELGAVFGVPGEQRSEPEHQWQVMNGTQAIDKPGEYEFDAQAHFPTDRLRFELPQSNTVAVLQLFSRDRAERPWRAVARTTAYRLNSGAGELASPALPIGTNADRYWLLRVDQRGGGVGSGTPALVLGWIPQQIAFAARGAAPFSLAFGQPEARSTAIGIEALIPGYREGDDAALGPTSTAAGTNPLAPAQASLLAANTAPIVPAQPGFAERWHVRQLALWSLLVAAVLLLAWMAWRLLRQMNTAGKGSSS